MVPFFSARADECRFRYWEVIPPSTKCSVFHLPNFDFRSVPQPSDTPDHIKRFCTQYEISSALGTQTTSYCHTGLGDQTGPIFRLGDEDWNVLSDMQDKVYLADLNFEGCANGTKAQGIVFAVGGWAKAPAFIQRSWPLELKVAKCKDDNRVTASRPN